MEERVHLRPVEGMKVPHTGRGLGVYLRPEGEVVALNAYWRRRLAEGCVERVPAAKPKKKES